MIATKEQTIEAPAPGIYEDVPFETYLSWPLLSNSRLKPVKRSLLHFRDQEPIEETAAMRLGTFCHVGRLEPSAIYRRYVVMPDLTAGIVNADGSVSQKPKATKQYAERVNAWLAQHEGMLVVDQDEFDRMVGILSALDRDTTSRSWFADDGPVELSIVWDDPETGLRLKGRIDKLARTRQVLADLKTCSDCLKFQNAIAEYGYHRQGAMYLEGWEILTGEILRCGLAAAENTKPHGVMAALVRESDIELGNQEFHDSLRKVAKARETGTWPGYVSPSEWTLPGWYGGGEASEPITLSIGGEKVQL